MTREAKVGLMMVVVLVGVFGFLIYKRVHLPNEGRAAQSVASDNVPPAVEPVAGGVGDALQQTTITFEPAPATNSPQIIREVEKVEAAVAKVAEDFAEDVVAASQPVVDRAKNATTKSRPANDDDFSQFEPVRAPQSQPQTIQIPEPAEAAFDDYREPTPAPRKIAAPREPVVTADPFSDDTSSTSSIDYKTTRNKIRQVNAEEEAFPEDSNDAPQQTQEPSFSQPTTQEFEVPPAQEPQSQEPQRTTDFSSDTDYDPKPRRKPAPSSMRDEFSSATSIDQAGGMVAGPTYKVQPNDNFWSISRKRYGAGRYYMALALHNRQTIPDPKMMKPGVVISTPDVSFLEDNYANSIPKPAPVDTIQPVAATQSRKSTKSEPAGFFLNADGEPMYRVGSRDTLTDIAKDHLGRSSRWVQILEMNRNVLRDGNELKIGTELRLPGDASRIRFAGRARDLR